MKILFLHNLAEIERGGGAEVIVWEQMRGLRDAGHKCVLLATSNRPGLQRLERDGITIWQAGIRNVYWPHSDTRPAAPFRLLWHTLDSYNPWMQLYLRQVIERERPDVTSIHNLPGWSAASWQTLAQALVPSVQVLHDYYPICAKATMYKGGANCERQCLQCRAFRLPHRALSRNLRAVVGVSHFVLDRHLREGYFRRVPIQRVIHNARSPQDLGLDSDSRAEPHRGLRFGFLGRLHRVKGIEPLMDAFLAAGIPDAELWIAGSGEGGYEHYLRTKVTDERVRFLGRVPPRDFFPQVDIAVVPSLWNDNLPGVVFEALAFGKPVIGARRGGIPEMVTHEQNGILFEPDAQGELPRALRAMQDDRRRARLSAQARRSAGPYLDMARWIRCYETLYREVASTAPPAAPQEEPDDA